MPSWLPAQPISGISTLFSSLKFLLLACVDGESKSIQCGLLHDLFVNRFENILCLKCPFSAARLSVEVLIIRMRKQIGREKAAKGSE